MTETIDLSFSLKASELSKENQTFSLVATSQQKADLVERFGLRGLETLTAEVNLQAKDHGQGVLIHGQLKAALTQACIVSLQDVDETIDGPFELLLVDPELANRMDEDENYLDPDAPEYDALEGDVIEVGEVVAQTLSILMNPYPRAEGAEVSVPKNQNFSLNEPELEKPNPFAALSQLKDKS